MQTLPKITDTRNGLTGASRGSKGKGDRPRAKSRWVWAIIVVLIISTVGFAFAVSPSMQKSHTNYDPHAVIIIEGNAELQAQATAEGWQGDGSEIDPIVIQGYEIAAMGHDRGMYVRNTTHHLVIDNCYVHDATYACISLVNVTNITVSSNNLVNGQRGIEVSWSNFVSMVGNNCTMANEGIAIMDSEWCSVVGNNCSGNIVGMSAESCGNISMHLNTARGNVISGIRVVQTSHFVLANNTCVGGQFGVQALLSEFGSILNSTTSESSDTGIYLNSCHACTVEDNRCSRHGSCGICIEDSPGCRVRGNEASGCGHGIRASRCDDIDVGENDCRDNRGHGIWVEDSGRCTLADNYCHGNGGDGLAMGRCHDGWAERNRCEDNGGSGLRCYDGERCHVGHNLCTDNEDCGLRFHGLVQGEVTGNEAGRCRGDALRLDFCEDINVSDNLCYDSDAGMRFSMCSSCQAYNNSVNDSVLGIAISHSTGIVLRQNAMLRDGIFIDGPTLEHWSTHEIDPTNTANGLPVLYLVSAVGLNVVGAPGQVILADCAGITIDGLDLGNATVGVEAGFSSGIKVLNSSCSDGYVGVYGYNCYDLLVGNSNCSRNAQSGVEFDMCDSSVVWMTVIEDNDLYGVRLNLSAGCSVGHSFISGCAEGIATERSASAGFLVGNAIANCTVGVSARFGDNLQLHLNEIENCDYGVLLNDSRSMSMVANTLVGCGLYIDSGLISCWDSHSVDSGNTVNGKALAYLVGASGTALPSSTGQAVLVGCTWVTASLLDLTDASVGILAGFSSHITVMRSNLSDNQVGAEFVSCADCAILSNTIADCAVEGVRITGSSGCSVESNRVVRCGSGICVRGGLSPSIGNMVATNNVSECTKGIVVNGSPETTVAHNTLMWNLACGVMVEMSDHAVLSNNTCNGNGDMAIGVWGSSLCTVANNSCSMNSRGIYLWSSLDCNISGNLLYGSVQFGVCLDSACSGNAVWDNVFAYNNGSDESYDPLHAQARDDGMWNYWNSTDLPHGSGNYWHDWTTPDADLDGFVDLPYNLSGTAKAKDYYPLAETSEPIEPIPEFGAFFVVVCLAGLVFCLGRRKPNQPGMHPQGGRSDGR